MILNDRAFSTPKGFTKSKKTDCLMAGKSLITVPNLINRVSQNPRFILLRNPYLNPSFIKKNKYKI